jgi:S-adenosylmethionine:tRNA ribosyltransferase-isomerase
MDVRDFDFDLPAELIAQEPASERGAARLLVLNRDPESITHTRVRALPDLLRAGDLVVVNNTRVFPARLLGHRVPSGGAVECLLVRPASDEHPKDTRQRPVVDPVEIGSQPGRNPVTVGSPSDGVLWEALVHPGQKLKPGARVVFEGIHALHGEILERRFFGRRVVRLWTDDGSTVDEAVDAVGHVPLPPYIKRADRADDRDRYQTLFAQSRGSIAAPTLMGD